LSKKINKNKEEHMRHFGVNDWGVHEEALELSHSTLAETVFAQANGYIGTRGTHEEGITGNPASTEGTYLNGLFVRTPYDYPENAHAFATHNNKIIQVPNGKAICVSTDGETFLPGESVVEDYSRHLDFQTGLMERSLIWSTTSGKRLKIASRRLVSLINLHLLAIEYQITAENFDGAAQLESCLDAAYGAGEVDPEDPRVGHLSITKSLVKREEKAEEGNPSYLHQIKDSDVIIRSAACEILQGITPARSRVLQEKGKLGTRYEMTLKQGQPVTLTKFITYHHGVLGEEATLAGRAADTLKAARKTGFAHYAMVQQQKLAEFWSGADVTIDGDPELQQGIRFNLFHIYQSAGKDGRSNIGAKGLTGPGYDGHYFWDTEIYIIPFFVYSYPEVARSLLEYRYSILDKARERAQQMSHTRGALFAWRTIGGEECSAYFPAGTAQYHINAAVAYAIRQYLQATQDWDFIGRFGAEILWETARIWMGIGHFNPRKGGQFCIHTVTGPDEYTAVVDNNFYTNAMARQHLRTALEVAAHLKKHDRKCYDALVEKICLEESELAAWKKAEENMYLPYDKELGINPQDDTFLDKPHWDFENTPAEKYPLLLHYHPLVIYRHQVLKQIDVVLAMVLLSEQFDTDLKRRNFEYYDPITTHDSTLSTSMNSVACSELGLYDKAYQYFEESVRMDLDNRHRNTEYGLHTACMAGSWMTVVLGFGGMQIQDDKPSFNPYLPRKWPSYAFSVRFRESRVHVAVRSKEVVYTLTDGNALEITHAGKPLKLVPGKPVTVSATAKEHAA